MPPIYFGTTPVDGGEPLVNAPPGEMSNTRGWQLTTANTGLARLGINGSQLPLYTGPGVIPAGSRISNVRFAGPINLNLGDIIIERCLIQPLGAGAGLPLVTTTDFNNFIPPAAPVIIRDCEIDATLLTSNRPDFDDIRFRASVTAFEGIATLERNYVHGMGSGLVIRRTEDNTFDFRIEHNYVRDMIPWGNAAADGSHNNCISIRDFDNRVKPDRVGIIRDNRLELYTPSNASSVIQIAAERAPINNVTVQGNWIDGYGYTLWLSNSNWGFGTNMQCRNNRFTPLQYYPSYAEGPGWNPWEDNFIYDAQAPDARGAVVFPNNPLG